MCTKRITLPGQATGVALTSSAIHRIRTLGAARISGIILSLGIMLVLKQHYSQATVEQLDWILAPTAWLVAWLTPAHPVFEFGVGYVDFAQGIIVAPACAGVNFMIMTFGMTMWCGLTRTRSVGAILWLLTAALILAYAYTIVVNTVRIGCSMLLYSADIYNSWLTLERGHRIAGIGLYMGALWLYFLWLRGILYPVPPQKEAWTLSSWLPLGWYVVGAAGVPLVNQMFQRQADSLGEHCLTIAAMTLLVYTLVWSIRRAAAHFRQ